MVTFDNWRPHKLEEHGNDGIQQVSAARNLLETHAANLSRSNRDVAQGLLDYAEDLRLLLQGKHLLARIKLARRYDRKAVEVLHVIEGMLDLHNELPHNELGPLN